ncbi:bifunctional DNA primase/polymerase [Lentzea aerocolonigenes]|uniref:bifunctional DNA primase/polymerase n=1 Tax=Lentzea aerocolonigenes TaxID=68170 RepID=UPI0004C44222|nr:bifunctional DNA primase/polymerase [Lentzea aerocolonigenes]MCP2242734.1 Bifunctional DNA primase/polymerase, N-terminal [Lentzea aerocolonigenes]
MSTEPDRLTEILRAAARGWHIFPAVPDAKRPFVDQWEARATTDPAVIRDFYTRYPRHNVAIATGPSNLVVVDCDVAKPDEVAPDGFNMLGVATGLDVLTLLAERAKATIPPTYAARTPSGGTHLYFLAPKGTALRNTAGTLGWLVDTRAHGGYVIAPPSTTPAGRYEITDDRPPVELPAWLVQAPAVKPPMAVSAPNQSAPAQRSAYLDAIVRGECAKVAAAQRSRHNKTLFQAALSLGQLVGGNEISHSDAAHMLEQSAAHMAAGDCDCTPRQITATVQSGLKLGATNARRLDNRAA